MEYDRVDTILSQWRRERPDLDPSPMGVIGRISQVSRHIERTLQEVFTEFGLTAGEFDVLAALRRAGAPYHLSPTELFNTLMLSSGAMTHRIDRLEAAKLVVRNADPTDRRGVLVTLTPAGLSLIDHAVAVHLRNEQRLLNMLSEAEQAQLANLLRKMLHAYEQ